MDCSDMYMSNNRNLDDTVSLYQMQVGYIIIGLIKHYTLEIYRQSTIKAYSIDVSCCVQ